MAEPFKANPLSPLDVTKKRYLSFHTIIPMMPSTALLKMPKVLPLAQSESQSLEKCRLLWRRQLLLIRSASSAPAHLIPALRNPQWFESCLKQSPIKLVRLEMNLGEEALKSWANACATAHKRVFIHLPAATGLPKARSPIAWWFKRIADWLTAASLTVCLSPLLLLLAALVHFDSPGPIFFKQWRVGRRGQLFQILKFRTMRQDAEQLHHQLMEGQKGLHKLEDDPRVTALGRWLRKYSLDELPQIFNVLRGEMSLVGPRPLALYDAIRIGSGGRKRLNALPGMTGFWQVKMRSNQCDLEVVSQHDLDYLKTWSLFKDLQLVLLTFPKVLSGFGAF